jgi:NADH-quinone oxidoreductase subunit J
MRDAIFYLLMMLSLVSGALAVTESRIFRAAIYLLFSLLGIAFIYLMLGFEFVFAVQAIVYVGGIVVLIIFSIFLTRQTGTALPEAPAFRRRAAMLAVLTGFGLLVSLLLSHSFQGTTQPARHADVHTIGTQLLNIEETGLALPFEIISVLLLAAMIGCIVIALKKQPHTR